MQPTRAASPLFSFLIVIASMGGVLAADGMTIDETDTPVRVIDGDTFVGRRLGGVRLADVDAPEVGTRGAREATEALAALVHGRFVFLDVDNVHGTDRYGRIVAEVFVENNATHLRNVNLALLRAGVVRVADFPNEFEPSAWLEYVPRPKGMPRPLLDSAQLKIVSIAFFVGAGVLGVLIILGPSLLSARKEGKVEPRYQSVDPPTMESRTWRGISPDRFDELREVILRLGATEDAEVRGQSEVWRCRVDDGVFTLYETGTLHFSGAKSREAEIAARGVELTLLEG